MIDIFSYTDYREYLSDYLYELKKEDKRNTHRTLSKKAGYSSSSFFSLVITGKRNLVRKSLDTMLAFLSLKKREELYFISMVEYDHEKDPSAKLEKFKELTKRRKSSTFYKINQGEFEYFSKWYIPVVKEVISFANVGKDISKIAAVIRTKLTNKEVEEAIAILLKLDIIKEKENSYSVNQKLVSAANVPYEILRHIKKEYIYKAIEAMDDDVETRYISSSTVSISKESYTEICDEIDALRRKIMKIAEKDENCDRVIQFNFQGYHLTDVFERKGGLK